MSHWLGGALLSGGGLEGILADATAKGTILLLLAWLTAWALRRSSAALRHRLWALTLEALIALPAVSALVPGWRLPVLPAPVRSNPAVAPPAAARALAASPTGRADDGAGGSSSRAVLSHEEIDTSRVILHEAPAPWTMAGRVVAIWGLGFLGVALPTLLGIVANEWRRRRARPLNGEEWLALVEPLRRRFSIGRAVELRQSGASPIALTWGVVRPVVLLPEDAEGWSEPTRRLVLLHELAHVQRFDTGHQLVGRLAAALYWFHPLVWFALQRLRLECEQACDDCVVLAGERPTNYARQLLELARSLRKPRLSMTVAMARTNHLERRLKALFDETRSHMPLGRRSGRLLVMGVSVVVLGLATVHPGPSAAVAGPGQPPAGAGPAAGNVVEAPPEAPGRIAGRVVRDGDGGTVAGADVILLLPPPGAKGMYTIKYPLRRTSTDAKGMFSFDGLPPGRYRVWANSGKLTSSPRRKRGEPVVVVEAGEAPKAVELRLVDGVALTVRVKEEATGKPIPGATVHLIFTEFDDLATGVDGTVRIQPLTAERRKVTVWADGFAQVARMVNLEDGADSEAEFRLIPGGDLEGVVRDPSGKPLADVGLSVHQDDFRREQIAYVQTDREGRYRLAHLPLNVALGIWVSKPDYLREDVSARVTGATQALDLTLKPRPDGGAVAGIVLDHAGRPIAGAELVNWGNSSSEVRETKTGPDGRFRLENLFQSTAGKEVIVRARGSAPKRVPVMTGTPDRPAEITITLEPGHRINGRVTDAEERPLEGVRVDFGRGILMHSDGGMTTTDKEGHFTFDSLPPKTLFGFSKEGYSQIVDRQLLLDTDEVVSVAMVPAGAIAGKVFDARTGKPIPAFKVQVTFSPRRQPGEPTAGLLSELSEGADFQSGEGRFKVANLVAGMPLQVMVSAEGYERHVKERVVVAEPNDARLEEFRLDPVDPATLRVYRGRLLDAQRTPVAGAQLRLIALRGREFDRPDFFLFNWPKIRDGQLAQSSNVTRFLAAVTDARGGFEFKAIPRASEVVLAWWGKGIGPGQAAHLERRDDAVKESLEITIPAPARIVGTVDRKAFAAVRFINLVPTEQVFDRIEIELSPDQTDFAFGDLAPGTYHVSLMGPWERMPGSPGGFTNRRMTSTSVTVGEGETARLDFK